MDKQKQPKCPKAPDICKTCAYFHDGGIKDGKHDRWCCNYGRPAAKAIGECKLKGGYKIRKERSIREWLPENQC